MAKKEDVANLAAQAGAGMLGESGQATVVADMDEQDLLKHALDILRAAPSLHDVLARPMVYEAWLKKVQEAVNG